MIGGTAIGTFLFGVQCLLRGKPEKSREEVVLKLGKRVGKGADHGRNILNFSFFMKLCGAFSAKRI
jgi:hypothetical protein